MLGDEEFFKGRGAQINGKNPFLKQAVVAEFIEGIDAPLLENSSTHYIEEHPKKIINKVDSPDLGFPFSMNPYQGCEHGCVYCYARNVHHYWGYSAGLDFERKIIVKKNAPQLLSAELSAKGWTPAVIALSGNTDCYQPIERKLKITRGLLKVLLEFKNPVSIITKNNLILRDMDILTEMASMRLVKVAISINSLNETLRQKLEPRTVTASGRLRVLEALSKEGVPCMVMNAPVIPGLNSDEIPSVIQAAADHGALGAGMTIVRLNGAIGEIFTDWIYKAFPEKAQKVLAMIAACHGGKLNDSIFGQRMRGTGNIAESIHQLFQISVKKYLQGRAMPAYNFESFRKMKNGQTSLF